MRYAIFVAAVFTALSRIGNPDPAIEAVGAVSLIVSTWLGGRFACHVTPWRRPAPMECDPPVPEQWRAFNSPTDMVPSHGTYAFAQAHAVDLVDARAYPTHRPPDLHLYPSYGTPVSSGVVGVVVHVTDRIGDHRVSTGILGAVAAQLRLLSAVYRGTAALLGNHVIIESDAGRFVLLAHLKRDSIPVAVGDRVDRGTTVGACGNTGSSSEPHLHLQFQTSRHVLLARSVPFTFRGHQGLPAMPDTIASTIGTTDDVRAPRE